MTNRKTTKRALFTSMLALLMCVAMLVGTTFAWFTDTASTNVNKVQAGTLKVALVDKENNSLEGKTLSWQKATGHESDAVLWEPGATYSLQPITIKNDGNLALKYKIAITGIKGDTKLNNAIDWSISHKNEAVATASNGEADSSDPLATEYHLTAGQSHMLTISGTMKTTAGNEYMGLSIEDIAITVYATQDTVEYDSTTNEYDKNATYDMPWDGKTVTPVTKSAEDDKYHIANAEQLVWVMNNTQTSNSPYYGETIVLDGNIDLGGNTVKGIGSEQCNFAGNFDGQGFTISNFVIERTTQDIYAGLFNYVTYGTISNLTVADASINGDESQVGALVGGLCGNATVKDCSVVGCTVSANRKVGGAVGYVEGGATVENVSVKDTTIYVESTGDTQYGKVVGFKNTGAAVNNSNDENVTIVFMARVNTPDALAVAINNFNVSRVVLSTDVTNDTPPHDGGDSPYHPYQTKDQYTIKKGRELTIDLNGETYEASVRLFHVLDGGKLTITSSKPGGKITINTTDPDFNYAKNAVGMQVEKDGVLNIEENVTIEMNVVGVANPVALCINNGTVNMNGGELIVYDSAVFTNYISNFGTFNMNGGKITLESKQTNETSTGFALWGSGVTANLNAGSIEGKGLAYNKATVTYFGESNVVVAEGFVINTTQGPST